MEVLGLIDLPNWLLLVLAVVLPVYVYTKHKRSYFSSLGIPTKPSTFLIGDFIEMARNGANYINEDTVKQHGKVFGSFLGNIPVLNICDAEMAKQITVKEFSKFTDRHAFGRREKKWMSSLPLAEGDHWRFLRSTISPAFSSGKLKAMKPYVDKCFHTFQELLEKKIVTEPEGFDIVPFLNGYAMDLICSVGFGLDVSAQTQPDHPLIKNAKEIVNPKRVFNPFLLLQLLFPDIENTWLAGVLGTSVIPKKLFDVLASTSKKAIEERRKDSSQHKDLLQNMINAHKPDATDDDEEQKLTVEDFKKRGLTDQEILINSVFFMLGGYETTNTLLSWLLYELAVNPNIQDRLVEEIDRVVGNKPATYDYVHKLKYVDMVVNETLRLHTPAPRILRKALEDTEINGIHIKKGMHIAIRISAMHFMAEYWQESRNFNPERFSPENQASINEYAYLPFGLGPRNCIGKRLALLEIKTTLISLLQKFRFHKTDKLKVPMSTRGVSTKPSEPVFIRAERRK